jgi:cell shape-determining protein MreC
LMEEIFALKQRLGEDVNTVTEVAAPVDTDAYSRKLLEALKESEKRVGELAMENERLRKELNSN